MELRGAVMVEGLDIESDEAGELHDVLNEAHGHLGPVLSGASATEVILATDRETEAEAARELLAAVRSGLDRAGLQGLAPGRVELEPAD